MWHRLSLHSQSLLAHNLLWSSMGQCLPLLGGDFPLPGHGSLKAPTVTGLADVKAWRSRVLSPDAEGRGASLPVASSSHTEVLDTASPLAGKRRGPESVSDAESAGVEEIANADSLAMVPLTPCDTLGHSLRRSSRDHKKPRPYYAGAQADSTGGFR